MQSIEQKVTYIKLKRIYLLLRQLATRQSWNVLFQLSLTDHQSVLDLCRALNKDQSSISQVLSFFVKHEIASFEKIGQYHYYTLNHKKMIKIKSFIDKINSYERH